MIKKILSVALAAAMLLSFAVLSAAEDTAELAFKNGDSLSCTSAICRTTATPPTIC